jgi:hypothetical protein
MKMRLNGVFFAFLLIALAFTGCGGGGGPAATDTSADQLLASQLVGTWKLSQATKNGVLVPVLPTDSGEIGTISFNADRTATGSDYTITTSSGATVVDPNNPTPPPSTDFYKTTAVAASSAVHSWAISNGSLVVQAATGKTITNRVEIKDGKFYQTMPNGEIQVWVRA